MADALASFSCAAVDEVLCQQCDIFFSLAQRRKLDWKNLEPIIQIASKRSVRHGRIQVTIRSGDNANVDPDGLSASNPLEFSFLKYS